LKVTNIKEVEDCIESGTIFEFFFDKEIDNEFIVSLGKLGRLYYYDTFSKPFFKVITFSGVQIKGILGDPFIKVFFPSTDKEKKKEEFEKFLSDLLKK